MLGEWTSLVTMSCMYSGVMFDAHTRAQERKKRCCGVKPSFTPKGFYLSEFSKAV